jgi:signal transduction histidine kinase/ActR/RegA family two-component response regulator
MSSAEPHAGSSEPHEESPLQAIRKVVLRRFLMVFAASIALAELIFLPVFLQNDRLPDLIGGLVILAALVGALVAPISYRTRAWALLGTLSLCTTSLLFFDGLATGPTLLGFSVPFMAVLFLGLPASIVCFAWWILSIAVFGMIDQAGIYHAAENPTLQRMDPDHWPFLALSQIFVGAPIVYLAHLLMSKLESALEHERAALVNLHRAQDGLAASERHKTLALLAGGIAHDLNNTLTVIACQVELARGLPAESRESILSATDAASQLSSQILASSGDRVSQTRPIDLLHTLKPAIKGLGPLLPRNITLDVRTPGRSLTVLGDPVLLQQVLLNLTVNARDAMPEGGDLTIELDRVARDGEEWAEIVVRDTGEGMDEATLARATEPFFTTKGVGRGTGLGLANVRSTIEGLGGEVRIESAPGTGTTVRLSVPMTDTVVLMGAPRGPIARVENRSVLLVDDDLRVRAIAFETLQRAGYTVLEAADLAHAIPILERCEELDAAVCDLVLVDGSGLELARMVRQRFPDAGILVVSGYAPSSADRDALRRHEFPFLAKPFRPRELVEALNDACEAPARSA